MAEALHVLEAQHRAALEEGRLQYQCCRACGHAWMPVRERCPACLADDWSWRRAEGGARIVSWVVYHVAYDPAWADRVPYNVALVELDEGPRMITNVLADNDALAPGARLRLKTEREGESTVARFALA